jgi:hypothetical protein
MRRIAFLVEFASGHARSGETAEAHAAIDEALERCQRNEEILVPAGTAAHQGRDSVAGRSAKRRDGG